MLWPHVDGPDNVRALRLGVPRRGTVAWLDEPPAEWSQAWDGDVSVLRTTVTLPEGRIEILDAVDPDEPVLVRRVEGDPGSLVVSVAPMLEGADHSAGAFVDPSSGFVVLHRRRAALAVGRRPRRRDRGRGVGRRRRGRRRPRRPARGPGSSRRTTASPTSSRRSARPRSRRSTGPAPRRRRRGGTREAPARRRAPAGRDGGRVGRRQRPRPPARGARCSCWSSSRTGRPAGSSRHPRWTRPSPSPAATGSSGRATSRTSCSACSRAGAATLRRPPCAGSPARRPPRASGCTATGRPASRRPRGGSISSTRPASRWSRPRPPSGSSADEDLDRELWPVVRRAADLLVSFLDPATGLPRASTDLWEQHDGQYAYSSASVVGGLRAAALAAARHDPPLARGYEVTASRVADAIDACLWDRGARAVPHGA